MRIVCALIVGALLSHSAAARQARDPLDDLFARGRSVQAGIKTLAASFTETTVSSLLRDPVVATGALAVSTAPTRIVMTYATPAAKTIAIDATRLIVAWPTPQKREALNIGATQRRIQKYFADASLKELRETFTITLAAQSSVPNTHEIDLVARRKPVAEGVEHLRLWVDQQRLLMVKMAMDFPGGDSTTFELRDIRVNVAIDESVFAILRK